MSLDRRILELLERDARHTPQQIAAMLGEDENRVIAEIARGEGKDHPRAHFDNKLGESRG